MFARPGMLFCIGQLAACAGPGAGMVAAQFSAIPAGHEEWRPLGRGQTLRSGDRYDVRIDTDRPVYVYVARIAPSGGFQLLFPRGGEGPRQVQPRDPLHVPTDAPWFELDGDVGAEDLRVVASLSPLPAGRVKEEAIRPAAQRGREPPPIRTDKDRGQEVVRAWIEPQGKGAGGVAVVRFSFKHE